MTFRQFLKSRSCSTTQQLFVKKHAILIKHILPILLQLWPSLWQTLTKVLFLLLSNKTNVLSIHSDVMTSECMLKTLVLLESNKNKTLVKVCHKEGQSCSKIGKMCLIKIACFLTNSCWVVLQDRDFKNWRNVIRAKFLTKRFL